MRIDKDALGNRMKEYEGLEANRVLMKSLPINCRIDGRSFHSWTRGLKRPYDERFIRLMTETAKFLVEETNAVIAYHQSDELSLIIHNPNIQGETFFNGRIQKLTSVIASMTTAFFNKNVPKFIPEKADKLAFFDCRIWNTPTLEEAVNNLIFRELDATKNSVSMAAQSMFSHKQLQGKNGSEMQDMMMTKGVNWNDYCSAFKRGSYIKRVKVSKKLTVDELNKLPPKHAARMNKDLIVERREVQVIYMPKLTSITNRVDVIFNDAKPILNKK